MDYKDVMGKRLRESRANKGWTQGQLSVQTGDVIGLKRISAYEKGDRMMGPSEAVILAQALGVRPAYLMAVDDTQMPITPQEENLIKNWRTLAERERMDFYRKIQTAALQSRDPVQDQTVERHIPVPEKPRGKVTAMKRVKTR